MKKLLDPKWIFLINTFPILILLFITWGEFQIVKSLLDAEEISLWTNFAVALAILLAGSLTYAINRMIVRKPVGIIYSAVALLAYSTYLYLYVFHSYDIIPRGIPEWMLSGNLITYGATFIMPTLIYSLFCLVVLLTKQVEDASVWKNFAAAIGVPAFFYLITVLPISQFGLFGSEHTILVGAITLTCIFLFFFIRGFYVLLSKKEISPTVKVLFKIVISLAFPLIGLVINGSEFNGLFGDFTDKWFYILTVINALMVSLPSLDVKQYRLFLFFGRSITLTYSLYFFLVFLPFLPLSIVAILVAGAGFLMLAPLVLFVVHINEITGDINYLKQYYGRVLIYAGLIIGFMVLPVAVTVNYMNDKQTLNGTLDYLYHPDYAKEDYELNAESLLKMFDSGDRKLHIMSFYTSTPFLSSYYKWLVFDNLNLSSERKQLINSVFSGWSFNGSGQDFEIGSDSVKITEVKHSSVYDNEQKAWISQIDLSIKNLNGQFWRAEYKTLINLPVGCWISDYYLYVGDVKEMGILAEKKAASWIFAQIQNENRDPGLLRYLSGNRVEFKVFPFQPNETRYTGIEFIHKEPVEINIDGHLIALGTDMDRYQSESVLLKDKKVAYISAADKQNLASVQRTPYYHFILDVSASAKFIEIKYEEEVEKLIAGNQISPDNAKISYVGAYVKTTEMKDGWANDLKTMEYEGGFFLDRAIKKILFEAYTNPTDGYPVIVVVSNNSKDAILYNDFTNFEFAFPETDIYYVLDYRQLTERSLTDRSYNRDLEIISIPEKTVKAWPSVNKVSAYLPDNNRPSVVVDTKDKILRISGGDIKSKNWNSGLLMQAQWMLQVLYPETGNTEWLALIQNSFKSGIMTPFTSYIVVENEAQKAMLKKKQAETLSGNRSLDLEGDVRRMSEPDLFLLALLLIVFYAIACRKRKRNEMSKLRR